MIDREVYDIILGSLATLKLYLVLLSETQGLFIQLQLISLLVIIFLSFTHMIFRQLNRVSDFQSQILILLAGIFALLVMLFHIILPPSAVEGFWSGVDNGYTILSLTILIVMMPLSILGSRSRLLE